MRNFNDSKRYRAESGRFNHHLYANRRPELRARELREQVWRVR